MSGHAETPAGTVPKYRPGEGPLHQVHTLDLLSKWSIQQLPHIRFSILFYETGRI